MENSKMQSGALYSSPTNPRRILVRGVNWLGDAVMTTPALQRLREAFPDAHIALLSHEKLAGLWQDYPHFNSLLTFASDQNIWQIARRLRSENFDLGLIFPNSARAALEMCLAKIPQRIGAARSWRNFFLTQKILPRAGEIKMRKRSVSEIKKLIAQPSKKSELFHFDAELSGKAHHLHHYLHLVATLGANPDPLRPSLEISNQEVQLFKQRFEILENETLLGLNPGAEYGPAKRWPAECFSAAAIEIQKKINCRWLIFGGASDFNLAEKIAAEIRRSNLRQNPVLNLSGQTTLRELGAALKACAVLLTNDSGPMHFAAAVGTRVVVPFGSTSPEMTGPGLPGEIQHHLIKSGAPCSPCFRRECPIDFRCMKGIEVRRVVEAVLQAVPLIKIL
ncbi:MAG: glycosyltransferase family 9 protein [Verrucomicrobiota bacterium]|nr:glycosyltransferase family 9 protein [Verrucomicrobiota bacterium]